MITVNKPDLYAKAAAYLSVDRPVAKLICTRLMFKLPLDAAQVRAVAMVGLKPAEFYAKLVQWGDDGSNRRARDQDSPPAETAAPAKAVDK